MDCDAVTFARAHPVGAAQLSTECGVERNAGRTHLQLVDGLPLGIELAASRTRTMSLAEIAERLTIR